MKINKRKKWEDIVKIENKVNGLARKIVDEYIQTGRVPESLIEDYKQTRHELANQQVTDLIGILYDNSGMVYPEVTCNVCGKTHTLEVKADDWQEWNEPNREREFQEIFPYLVPDERVLLTSGICGRCFDRMFDNV